MGEPAPRVERVATGYKFLEGPAWWKGRLVFSDNVDDRMYQYTPAAGATPVRHPSGMSNGNTVDPQGRLVTCAQDPRSIVRTEADGSLTTLADRFDGGKRFNSPNDVVVQSNGAVWFTDPPYGVPKGQKRDYESAYVFRIDATSRAVTAVVTDMNMPNGLAFSPDEKTLYISDTGKPHHIRAFDVKLDGTLGPPRVFCVLDQGVPDGFRVDATGHIWTSAGDGVRVYDVDGKLQQTIPVPETPANLCFDGTDGRFLYVTARTSLYKITLAESPTTKPVKVD